MTLAVKYKFLFAFGLEASSICIVTKIVPSLRNNPISFGDTCFFGSTSNLLLIALAPFFSIDLLSILLPKQ